MDRFIREKELEQILRVSRTTIWRWQAQGDLPKNRRIRGVVVWLESEIISWMTRGGES